MYVGEGEEEGVVADKQVKSIATYRGPQCEAALLPGVRARQLLASY
jgi:hypothetical protein